MMHSKIYVYLFDKKTKKIMNHKEHKEYLKEFKEYTKQIVATEDDSKQFLIRVGISNSEGELSDCYSPQTNEEVEQECIQKEPV